MRSWTKLDIDIRMLSQLFDVAVRPKRSFNAVSREALQDAKVSLKFPGSGGPAKDGVVK